MAAAIHRIELANGIRDIHVWDGHSELMALITFHGVPLGDIRTKAHRGSVSSEYLRCHIAERFSDRILQLWLEQRMNGKGSTVTSKRLPTIDVIVCTCDRPTDLKRCLRSLAGVSYERKSVLVVDNGQGDGVTRDVVRGYDARYVREEKRGLDFARNAGLRASEAELVAFADDDVVVDSKWLDSIVQSFEKDQAIACVTGLTMPFELETKAQEMFEKYSDGGMRRGYEGRVFDRFNLPPPAAGKVGVGANMAFRSAVLRQIGGFDEALDCGTPAKAGGDTDMFYRVLRHGYKICYEPRALAWHRHRTEMDELRNQLAGYGTAVCAFLAKCVMEHKDLEAIPVAYSWFKYHHLRSLALGLMGKGRMPWAMTLAELGGLLRGPLAYIRAKSYVSGIRRQEGLERRGRLNRSTGEPDGHGDPIRRRSAVLARLKGNMGRSESAQCYRPDS